MRITTINPYDSKSDNELIDGWQSCLDKKRYGSLNDYAHELKVRGYIRKSGQWVKTKQLVTT